MIVSRLVALSRPAVAADVSFNGFNQRSAGAWLVTAAAMLMLAVAAGCEDEAIHAYIAPKDPPRPQPVMAPADEAAPAPLTLTWDVPPDWRPAQAAQAFTVAAYEAGPAETPVSTTVTRLSGAGGGALANINRWRNQLGLPPVASLPEQPMIPITLPDQQVAGVVDLVGPPSSEAAAPPQRTIAAILPRQDTNETWFFKMSGPQDALEPLKEPFLQMIRSVRPATQDQPDQAESLEHQNRQDEQGQEGNNQDQQERISNDAG
ncbi:MAG TPA: hypothetical protein VF184_01400 [Phycisphaeraceae bacterium]